jgi:PAS domain S-box-containing protein
MSASPAEERRRLEREIRRLRNELQEAVHALPHLRQMVQFSGDLLLLTGPGSRILEANQQVAAVLGVAQAQLYGQSLQQWLVNPAQIEQLEQRLQAMAADAVVRMEVELQPAQGEPLILELEARRLADVATAEPRWTLALRELADQRRLEASRAAQDLQKALVTSVRRSENRVAEFSQRYQVLFEQSLDGLLLLDPAGALLEANAAAAGLFGVGDVNALLQLSLMVLAPDRQPGGGAWRRDRGAAVGPGHGPGACRGGVLAAPSRRRQPMAGAAECAAAGIRWWAAPAAVRPRCERGEALRGPPPFSGL